MGAKYITFLPLVVPDTDSSTGVSTDSVPSGEFGFFLSEIFDKWVENDIGEIKIQIFEEAARTAFNQEHTLCIFKVNCGGVPVVEHNGDFYSCDHYVNKEHCLEISWIILLSTSLKVKGRKHLAELNLLSFLNTVSNVRSGQCVMGSVRRTGSF